MIRKINGVYYRLDPSEIKYYRHKNKVRSIIFGFGGSRGIFIDIDIINPEFTDLEYDKYSSRRYYFNDLNLKVFLNLAKENSEFLPRLYRRYKCIMDDFEDKVLSGEPLKLYITFNKFLSLLTDEEKLYMELADI